MARSTQSKVLVESQTTTGRTSINLTDVQTVTALFITLISGTATIDIEISDDNPKVVASPKFIPLQTINSTSCVVISIPCAVIAINVTAISGEIRVSYRFTAGETYLNTPIQIFSDKALTPAPFQVSGSLVTVGPGDAGRIYGPAQPAPTTAATIYTVPVATVTTLSTIHVNNTTASPANFTMSIGVDAVAKELYTAFVVAANEVYHENLNITMIAGEFLQAFQGTAAALTMTLQGTEA